MAGEHAARAAAAVTALDQRRDFLRDEGQECVA
jgi:hypothetical protein